MGLQGTPYSATENDLIEFFRPAGVIPVAVHKTHDGSPLALACGLLLYAVLICADADRARVRSVQRRR